jgi:UDP-N-acetylmuramate: L-alanyl-gamma-D-glutamyl-meso-diaminopimelate ligase
MRIHFIAIGGSAMHNLAIALKEKGYDVSGSDDEIFEPSLSRLKNHGILPPSIGWDTSRITKELDAIVLGMHARADNPELLKAEEMGLKIYSYPEYLYEQTKDKTRIVIGGSHGKTTITSMVMHVLKHAGIEFDYMVGAQLEGFENMVGLKKNTRIAVFEGDEYLTSPIDLRPKFHLYRPTIGLISGIAWDHINAFPTYEGYKNQFAIFIDKIVENGTLV